MAGILIQFFLQVPFRSDLWFALIQLLLLLLLLLELSLALVLVLAVITSSPTTITHLQTSEQSLLEASMQHNDTFMRRQMRISRSSALTQAVTQAYMRYASTHSHLVWKAYTAAKKNGNWKSTSSEIRLLNQTGLPKFRKSLQVISHVDSMASC